MEAHAPSCGMTLGSAGGRRNDMTTPSHEARLVKWKQQNHRWNKTTRPGSAREEGVP